MTIKLSNIGKRFKGDWIFKDVNLTLNEGVYGLTGPNGSGKSTLLKLISNSEVPTEGNISFETNHQAIKSEAFHQCLSIATPYMDLVEQLSLNELLDFHFHFKEMKDGVSKAKFLELVYLENAKEKVVANFSSGMKQRLKLGLALLSNSKVVLLDEPSSNLDEKGLHFYQSLLKNEKANRIVIIASNEKERELTLMDKEISILDYKIESTN